NRRVELAAGEIVKKEQGFRALYDQVVHGHGNEIDADRVVTRGLDCDLDLGTDAVGRSDKDRVRKAGSLEIEQPTESANLGASAGAGGLAHQRLDQLHHAVAGVDVDTGGRVASLVHENHQFGQIFPFPGGAGLLGASYVGIAGC